MDNANSQPKPNFEISDPREPDPTIGRIERFQTLQTGQYWRAIDAVAEEAIEKGEVLLIESIRLVDDYPHTIILRTHPSKWGKDIPVLVPRPDGTVAKYSKRFNEHRFLLKDFLDSFEYEPDHLRIRSQELAAVQGEINGLQTELTEAQSNPAILGAHIEIKLREAGVISITGNTPALSSSSETGSSTTEISLATPAARPELVRIAKGSVADAIGTGITTERISALRSAAEFEREVATIKADWIQDKVKTIAKTITSMQPYYAEQAAAALAMTEDVRKWVAKIVQGIESLDLYVGKNVDVLTIREGESAPRDVPLTFCQKKLMMDEELAVFTDIDEWFDFQNVGLFFDALRTHDALIDQIFPTQRCVLVMAVTRRFIDYKDDFINAEKNRKNQKVFLLVRNGMNVHRVFSPVEGHLGADRLFPSKNEHDSVFRGIDGSSIKFEDVAYTDHLAKHERFALHYKRFLLLACGLDHRLKLFGDFYDGPASLHFVSQWFQDRHCAFIHDEDGANMLPSESRMSLADWVKEKNSYLRSGSRVMCNWSQLMNPVTAPGACKEYSRSSFDLQFAPKNSIDTVIAYRDGDELCVEIAVRGKQSYRRDRAFNCRVSISAFAKSHWEYVDLPYLCLDTVELSDVQWYIHNRKTRGDHLTYIRFFKMAQKFIQSEYEAEKETRSRMIQALADGGIAEGPGALPIVQQAVLAWRAANRGKPLPQFEDGIAPSAWKSLLDQMFMLAGGGERRVDSISRFVREMVYQPLRLALSGGAKLVIYAAPAPHERDDRLVPHCWVHRIVVEQGKTKVLEKSRKWVVLPKALASETTIHEWAEAQDWLIEKPAFASFERKKEMFGFAGKFQDAIRPFSAQMDVATSSGYIADWQMLRKELLRDSSSVVNPEMAIPFGLIFFPASNTVRYLCVGSSIPHALLYKLAANDQCQDTIKKAFVRPYSRQHVGQSHFQQAIKSESMWSLMTVSDKLDRAKFSPFFGREVGSYLTIDGKDSVNPLLSAWFNNWKAKDGKTSLQWFADGSVDQHCELCLDSLLGIHLPDDFNPVQVCALTTYDQTHKINARWYDIAPTNFDTSSLASGQRSQMIKNDLSSPSQALRFIENEVAEMVGNPTLRNAAELPDLAQPPEGVVRWYVLDMK